MIDEKQLAEVDEEIRRFQERVNILRKNLATLRRCDGSPNRVSDFPAETGAIRRASMDLTRALAKLRRWR